MPGPKPGALPLGHTPIRPQGGAAFFVTAAWEVYVATPIRSVNSFDKLFFLPHDILAAALAPQVFCSLVELFDPADPYVGDKRLTLIVGGTSTSGVPS